MVKKIFPLLFAVLTGCQIGAAELLNGGFEKALPKPNGRSFRLKLAENWETLLQSGSTKLEASLSEQAHSGKYSMRIKAIVPNSFGGTYQTVACTPDSSLELSMFVKGTANTRVYFRIRFFDAAGKTSGKKYLMPGWVIRENEKDKWIERRYKFKVPSNAVKMTVGIETLGNNFPDAEIFIDDVKLTSGASTVLRNRYLRAEIDPLFGGCIKSLELTADGKPRQFTTPRTLTKEGGMALEIIPGKRNPGLFSRKRYELSSPVPSRKIIVTRTENGGNHDGLRVKKTFALEPDSTKIKVTVELFNTGKKTIDTSCRIQNCLLPRDGFLTSPTKDWLQVFEKNAENIKTTNAVHSNNLQRGFLARSTPDAAFILGFDPAQAKGGYCWVGTGIDTMELTYTDIKLAPEEKYTITYFLGVSGTGAPVFAVNGDLVLGVDSLKAPRKLIVSPLKKINAKIDINGESKAVELLPGGKAEFPGKEFTVTCSGQSDKYTASYKAMFIKGIKLPPPAKTSSISRFDNFFPVIVNGDVALTWKESNGVDGYANRFLRNLETNLRECAAIGINASMQSRTLQKSVLPAAKLPDGRNLLGELCLKYDISLFPNTLLFNRADVDVDKFRPVLARRMALFWHKDTIDLMKKYDKVVKAVLTADETTAQNIPCMLEAHETLAKKLPHDVPLYPYLNIHARVYIPYVPVFCGDWYPISRKNASGRNPWNIGRVTAETVRIAGETPVHVILQSFGYFKEVYGFPTVEEFRLMSNLAAANGAKGFEIHEVNNRGLPWRYKYGYHYAARGNAGEYTPLWFEIGRCAREFTAIGTQFTGTFPGKNPAYLENIKTPDYRSKNGFYAGPQVKFFTLARKDGTLFAVAVNHSLEKSIRQEVVFDNPAGTSVWSLTKMAPASRAYTMDLAPGSAEYFVIGKEAAVGRSVNMVALERAKRLNVSWRIAADRAAGNGVDIAVAAAIYKRSVQAVREDRGLEALAFSKEAGKVLKKTVDASAFGQFDARWDKARHALSDACFMFLTHFDLVVPPEIRKATKRYEQYRNTADPEMQKLVDDVADCWIEYWQIEQLIVTGKLKDRSAAEKLIAKAHACASAATAYLKANAHKIEVDDPYGD
ncbi:MAG: hypothetical protein IJU70_12325 [Lentisphaeria bacterium]|nr:hypothetical protein [Lentisphaeria bacterium]